MPPLCGYWITTFILVLQLCHIITASSGSLPIQLDLALSQSTPWTGAKHLLQRDGAPITVPSIYSNQFLTITVKASIGTPPQQIEFILTTNAGDTVALATNDSTCAAHACGDAVFDATQSSTYKFLNSNFSITYADSTGGTGFYVTDKFTLGGTSVNNLQFGLLQNGSLAQATLGVGYISLEYAASSYANLPYRLYDQKAINVNAFSIWFENERSTSGKLAFGGVDTGKFNGSLEPFTISTSGLSYQYTTIAMSVVSGTDNGAVTTFAGSAANVAIDTSATALYLPNNTIIQIAQYLGATIDPTLYNLYVIQYSAMKNDSTIDITLGSTVIHIPLEYLTAAWNVTHALVWIAASGSGSNLLGVPFLRSTYTVFDYSHNQVLFAPLIKSNQSNVTSIPASGVAGLASTFRSDAASSTNNTSNGTTSNPPSTDNNSNASSGHGLSSSAKLGIGLGVGLGVPLIIAAIVAVVLLRKKRQQRTPQELDTPTTERYSHPPSSSAGSAFGGIRRKFRPGDDDIPELDGGYNPPNSNFGSSGMSAPSAGYTGSTSHSRAGVQ